MSTIHAPPGIQFASPGLVKNILLAPPAALDLTGFADFRVSTDTRIFLILQLIVIENTFLLFLEDVQNDFSFVRIGSR